MNNDAISTIIFLVRVDGSLSGTGLPRLVHQEYACDELPVQTESPMPRKR